MRVQAVARLAHKRKLALDLMLGLALDGRLAALKRGLSASLSMAVVVPVPVVRAARWRRALERNLARPALACYHTLVRGPIDDGSTCGLCEQSKCKRTPGPGDAKMYLGLSALAWRVLGAGRTTATCGFSSFGHDVALRTTNRLQGRKRCHMLKDESSFVWVGRHLDSSEQMGQNGVLEV